jgi:hypothetical protein
VENDNQNDSLFDETEPLDERVKCSDAELKQFALEIGCNASDGHSPTYLRRLLESAEPHILEMVRRKEVGYQSAAYFAFNTPREKQHGVSPKSIAHEGNRFKHGKTETAEREHKRKVRERGELLRQRQIAATKAAIDRARARQKVTDEEFERPPPELLDQEYPGRPGFTYASVHREQHGPIWINVSAKRRRELVIRLGEIAAEFSKHMEKLEILDDRQRASVFHRWRRALKPYLTELNATSDVEEPSEQQQTG